jgi:beta-phosphoglucomutase-like phosphatase (HAD superfamily)
MRHHGRTQGGKVVIEAVIFDMDGLLVDSEPVWDRVRKSMADEAGASWTTDDHKALMGVSTIEWAEYMIERIGLELTPQEVIDEVVGRMADTYRAGIPWLLGAV